MSENEKQIFFHGSDIASYFPCLGSFCSTSISYKQEPPLKSSGLENTKKPKITKKLEKLDNPYDFLYVYNHALLKYYIRRMAMERNKFKQAINGPLLGVTVGFKSYLLGVMVGFKSSLQIIAFRFLISLHQLY